MRKGNIQLIIFIVASAILVFLVIVIGIRQFDYLIHGAGIAETESSVNSLMDEIERARDRTVYAVPVKITKYIDRVYFVNDDEYKNLGTGSKELKCDDSADAHILIVKSKIKKKDVVGEKRVMEFLAEDVICKDLYDQEFNSYPSGGDNYIEGGDKEGKIYCIKFDITQHDKSYIDLLSWDVVGSQEACVSN